MAGLDPAIHGATRMAADVYASFIKLALIKARNPAWNDLYEHVGAA